MLALTEISRNTQKVVCMLVAAAIVTMSLAAAAKTAQSEPHRGYSVTVVEIQ
jgi:hypothetical protein